MYLQNSKPAKYNISVSQLILQKTETEIFLSSGEKNGKLMKREKIIHGKNLYTGSFGKTRKRGK